MHFLRKFLFLFLMLFSGYTFSSSAQSLPSFFKQDDTFLKANVKNGKVAYQSIKNKPAVLNELVKQIENISLNDASPKQKKAFYIDAYNVLTIHSVIEHGIPSSPMDVKGFFDTIKHEIAGHQLTLDELETNKLRKVYNDPRIHFAVVCSARSCPPIRPFAYVPDKLDEQLAMVTRSTLNSDFIRVDSSTKTAHISQIFKWYKSDFLKKADSVLDFINRYRKEKIPAGYNIDHYKYDWSLNGQRS